MLWPLLNVPNIKKIYENIKIIKFDFVHRNGDRLKDDILGSEKNIESMNVLCVFYNITTAQMYIIFLHT